MKIIQQIGILAIAFLILLSAGCSKKPVTPQLPPQQQPVTGKLAKLVYDTGAYDSLYYLADGRLGKLVNNIDPASGSGVSYQFLYNAAGSVERITNSEGGYHQYRYDNGKLITISEYIHQHKNSYKFFNYTNDVLTSMEIFTYNGLSGGYEFAGLHTYSFYQDGNLQEEITYTVNPFTGQLVKHMTITYSDYDNKLNTEETVRQVPYYYGVIKMKNNPGKRTVKREVNGVTTIFNSYFTYNQQLKPLTKKFQYKDPGGEIIETNTVYYYY